MNSRKKKIIIIGPTYPYRGGNSLYVSFVYETLSKEFEVKIFNYKLLYPSFLFPGKTQFDTSGEIKKIPSERIVNSLNPFNWISIASRINSEKPDLIIFDWWHPYFALCHFFISSFINKKLKKRILFITENYISHEGHFIDRWLTRIGLHHAKYFIALSQKVEDELKQNFKNKKIYRSELPIYDHLSGNAEDINSLKRKFSISEDEKVLLFFGYIRKYKGLDILLEALNILKSESQKIKLIVAGEFYDDKEFYSELIKKYDLEKRVIMQNEYIPNEKVKEYFLVSDVVVLPYRNATQSGILNLAYGFRKPVIVTKVGGLAEFVIDQFTGLVVDEAKADSLANTIKKFFEIENKIDFRKNIAEFVKSNRFNNLNEIINKVLEDNNDS
ncbi:MAG: glycosyl transferase family 1 [Ignavibacterium sp.]|uniref:glycosyltransferase n=1 Tax=Ignavibacterium sp. TaxID=2651167 RepID=UPI0021DC942F|nr:glycosyltransferase [Ignavibacterium sp.]BDQ02064.1 MAG: glycosyl transferase family 1 [Ignavibacterium sp.]GIV45190.1 MAG: glycosyl transferase family 1 [Ignavibacterium sp.]